MCICTGKLSSLLLIGLSLSSLPYQQKPHLAWTVWSWHFHWSPVMTERDLLKCDGRSWLLLSFLFMPFGAQKSLAFCLLSTWWYCQTTYPSWRFKIPLQRPQCTSTGVWVSNVQLLLKSPVVWNDWRLKPYETNTFLVVLSTHSKWAQIGCKFNPDLQTSANVLVNLIQPSGLFHPVSGFIVKSFTVPYMLPQ